MKKKIFGVFMMLLLFAGIHFTANAQTEFVYGNIVEKAISTGISQKLQLLVADKNGVETIYTCNSRIRINGTAYRSASDAGAEIPDGVYVKMAVEDGAVTIINYGSSCDTFQNVSYNERTNSFNGIKNRKSGLPIYCIYNDVFVPSYPDENHYYDIEVYDYAICITDVRSKDGKEVIKLIETGSGIVSGFLQCIRIYCETESDCEYVLKAEAYNSCGVLVSQNNITGQNQYEIYLESIENKTETYTLRFWLEDFDGNPVSSVYTKKHKVEAADIYYGYILQKEISESSLTEALQIQTVNTEGKEEVYTFASRAFVNGIRYNDFSELAEALPTDVFAKFAVENGEIRRLVYNEEAGTEKNVSDSVIKGKSLPVYYTYNNGFVSAYLDENHVYDIEVYDYAICITDMRSKDDKEVIKLIETDSGIVSGFLQCIRIYCETESDCEYVLKAEAYNSCGVLVSQNNITGQNQYEIYLESIENKTETYTLRFWLEDFDGNPVSSVYTKKHKVEAADIYYGYILQKEISESSLTEALQIQTVNTEGKEEVYTFASRAFVNGIRYNDFSELAEALPTDVFAKIAVENGEIKRLVYDEEADTEKNVSDSVIKRKSLPIYYRYNDVFTPAYIDGEHCYDIEVYDYAVCITNMTSKTMPVTIKTIETYTGINYRFMPYLDVYCVTDSVDSLVLKGELYGEKPGCIEIVGFAGCGEFELSFEKLKNDAKTYMIKLWLEDGNGNRVSSVYVLNPKFKKNDILYGDIAIKHTKTVDGKEKDVLNIRDIDGNERNYICDDNMIVFSPVSTLYDSEVEIPENAFVKFVAEDDVIKVIQIGVDTLEVASTDFKVDDGELSGCVNIMNNTEEDAAFKCVIAIFDVNGKLKTITSVPVEINADSDTKIPPEFDDYSYADGDYVKVFSWNDGTINPLFNLIENDVVSE